MAKSDPDWGALVSEALAGEESPRVAGILWRIVESQSQVATRDLVGSLEEQVILEEMLESSKPPRPSGTERLHYLLATPFRYPPLKWGSRFGGKQEPSIFYGSRTIPTALAEAAYYRLLFWSGMAEPPSAGKLTTQHDVFSARYQGRPGIRLQGDPFTDFSDRLTAPDQYTDTQALGAAMREAEVAGFEFHSARHKDGGINIGLFTPAALVSRRPLSLQRWICEVTSEQVLFSGESTLIRFPRDEFTHRGTLPQPA